MDTKECTKCGEVKPLAEYVKKAASKDGLYPSCKDCGRAFRSLRKRQISDAYREWAANNKEHRAAYNMQWKSKNKEALTAYNKMYSIENRDICNAGSARYKAAKVSQTPSWANDQLIAAYYKEAKRLEELTGIQFHVDHIIPLQGELVSGLHVETNLQLLPAHENIGKSNSFDPETFCA
jgi:transcription elongation factor Elf1